MRILFLNDAFPGRLGALAACLAADPQHEVLFASSHCRQGFSLPGVRRVLLKKSKNTSTGQNRDAFEQEWSWALKVGRLSLSSLLKLRAMNFTPDMVLTASAKGHAFFVRQVFPEAFYVSYLDDIFSPTCITDRYSDRVLLRHLLQSGCLTQSQLFFVFSHWQKLFFPAFVRKAIEVVPFFADTDFFCAEQSGPFYCGEVNLSAVPELVSFSVTGVNAERGKVLCFMVMALLRRRPHCHVLLSGVGPEFKARLDAVVSRLSGEEAARLHCAGFLPLREYRDLLCASAAHIRLDVTDGRLGELLEIMSCETLLMTLPHAAPESAEILRPGENMLFCPEAPAEEIYRRLEEMLSRPEAFNALRANARKTALAFRQQDILSRHAVRLLKAYRQWKDGELCNVS